MYSFETEIINYQSCFKKALNLKVLNNIFCPKPDDHFKVCDLSFKSTGIGELQNKVR